MRPWCLGGLLLSRYFERAYIFYDIDSADIQFAYIRIKVISRPSMHTAKALLQIRVLFGAKIPAKSVHGIERDAESLA